MNTQNVFEYLKVHLKNPLFYINAAITEIRIIFHMPKEEKEMMGKVYREFSRQRYNKYKHQFPKMRQSEIVSKIIREWDSLDGEGKEKLKKQYVKNKFVISEEPSESETAKRSEEVKKIEKETTHKKEETDQERQSSRQLPKQEKQLSIKSSSEQLSQPRVISNVSLSTPVKLKRIKKIRNNDYLSFFRHYYEKYSKEHPRWSANQISKIIKLLWKKRKNQNKTLPNHNEDSPQKVKQMSGRKFFKKMKNLTGEDSCKIWKHLPMESKIFWQNEAKGITPAEPKMSKMILKSNQSIPKREKAFEFLNKLIN